MTDVSNPSLLSPTNRVFVSYSWTSEEHQTRVEKWAERLSDAGVTVILDKKILKPGQDIFVFMERMVNDSSISKVLMMCDAQYAEKADNRTGGVGTEAQIVAAEIYKNVNQTKYVPVICEMRNGQPCCPAFLRSRKYIDFSTPERVELNFGELLKSIQEGSLATTPDVGSSDTAHGAKHRLELKLDEMPCVPESEIDLIYDDMVYVAKQGVVPPIEVAIVGLREKSERLAALNKVATLNGQERRERMSLVDEIREATETLNQVNFVLSTVFREKPLKMISAVMGYPGIASFLKGYFRLVNDSGNVTGLKKIDLWRDKDPELSFAICLTEDEFRGLLPQFGINDPVVLTLGGWWMADLPPGVIITKALPTLVHRLSLVQPGIPSGELDRLINPMVWKMGLG